MEIICLEHGERLTGSETNKKLGDYTKVYFEKNGYNVEKQYFSCINWKEYGVKFLYNGKKLLLDHNIILSVARLKEKSILLSKQKELVLVVQI